MSGPTELTSVSQEQITAELASGERFLLTTHENPDGDALGSLLAMHHVLTGLGKDSIMFLAAKEFPLPVEYRFMPLEEVFHEPPADLADRVVLFLDCGNIDRMPVEFLKGGSRMLNIDHHHDNTLFADVNFVDGEASSTAEIVFDLAVGLGAELTRDVADALYVGLVTDTGRFMYRNTDARTHRTAAALIEAGVDVNDTYRRLFEHVPLAKLKLLARALERTEVSPDGKVALAYIAAEDYAATGADSSLTEGVIDHLRSIEGVALAGVVRDLQENGAKARKVSLRSTDGSIDVSEIARIEGGGGHRVAAGFSTDMSYPEVSEFLREQARAQL